MKIIVASSNLFRRELSSFILSEAGYIVYEVSDSDDLNGVLNQTNPDLILLDDRLTGLNAHHHMYQDGKIASPIIIIKSNTSEADNIAPAFVCGDSELSWPYQVEDLLACVQEMLRPAKKLPAVA